MLCVYILVALKNLFEEWVFRQKDLVQSRVYLFASLIITMAVTLRMDSSCNIW